MIRAGDRQRNGALDALVLGLRGGGLDAGGTAAEHDLAGSIQIGHIHIAFRGEFADGGFLTAQHGQHRALSGTAGLLHEAAALKHELQAGGEIKRACRGMRGELPERQSGRRGDLELRHLRFEHFQDRKAVRVKRGLTAAGLRQLLHRAFKHHFRQREAQRGIRLRKKVCQGGMRGGQILAHADFLRALAGKEKNCVHEGKE